ncbi:ABC transporter [Paraconexibacter sp. AEG42_29]|uniref:ABC transporter n=1 Tax=Paraconexibacter sp. AEG42_29 TaxID=2997339 RepID=A0AAU7ATC9_9ACTN
MAVVIASDLGKDMAGEPLLRGVSFKVERRERLTIAGRNGAGKTTLLRMLSGETGIDVGELILAKGTRMALHDQRPPREQELSLREYVLSACKEPLELEAELSRLEQRMGEGDEKVFDRYAKVQAQFDTVGGYGWRDRAGVMIHGLGFVDADLERPLSTFSGGQLTRASLARALAAEPDLLLLDEPTNHLDIESLEWLEQTLTSLDTAIIMVAHDRWFLEAVGTHVLDLEAGRAKYFKGTWHQWRREQAMREMALGKAIEKQQAEIARLEGFVERFRAKATKAKQAQSRVKKLEKIDRIERDPKAGAALEFEFKKVARSGRVIFELTDGHLAVPSDPPKTLVDKAELWLERGEHVTLVGPNGAGKTTLIEALAGRRPFDEGKLSLGHNVELAYLSQHGEELGWGGARTVVEACVKRTGLPPNQARALLGRFLFSGETAEKPLEGLSGGERQRLSLAILVSSGANVLILDEPTNHLDIESREALEDALKGYEGGIILVSHDRALLEAVGTRTIAVQDYGLHSYVGGWPEYLRIRDERRILGLEPPPMPPPRLNPLGAGREERDADGRAIRRSDGGDAATSEAPPAGKARAEAAAAASAAAVVAANGTAKNGNAANGAGGKAAGGPSKNALKELAKLERAVEAAEAALVALEEELAGPEAWATPYETSKSTARHTAAKRAVDEAYAALESHMERTGT